MQMQCVGNNMGPVATGSNNAMPGIYGTDLCVLNGREPLQMQCVGGNNMGPVVTGSNDTMPGILEQILDL